MTRRRIEAARPDHPAAAVAAWSRFGAYARHAEAARAIAAAYFDSEQVLGRLVEEAMA